MLKNNFADKAHLFNLHFIVFIFGFTGVLGELIDLDAFSLVLNRMILASLTLFIFFKFQGINLKLDPISLFKVLGVGLLTAAHWVTFFHAIKISNVSVTLSCIASTAFMVSLIEPIIFKRKVRLYEMGLGLLVMARLYLIFRFDGDYTNGIIAALISAFLAACFSTLNGKLLETVDAGPMAFWEMLGGVISISIYMVIQSDVPSAIWETSLDDSFYLLLLGTVCTAYPMVHIIKIMKKISPYSVALAVNLEPVYGIVLAFMIFGEEEKMKPAFYIGTVLILAALFLDAVIKRVRRKRTTTVI